MPLEHDDLAPQGDGDPNQGQNQDHTTQPGSEHGDRDPEGAVDGDGGTPKPSEPVDERGVPIKNVVAEAKRRQERAERRAEEAERATANLISSMAKPAEQPAKQEEDLAELMLSNPQEYTRRITAAAVREASATATNSARWQTEQEKVLNKVFEDLPELSDKDSEFAIAVAKEYDAKRRYHNLSGQQHDAILFRDAANSVEIERSRASRKKSQLDGSGMERERPLAEGSAGGGRARTVGARKGEMTEGRRMVARELGLSDADAKDAYANYALDEG